MEGHARLRKIEINIYVHRFIEKHREHFGEPDCEILERAIRRITGDDDRVKSPREAISAKTSNANGTNESAARSYAGEGYVLRHKEQLEMEYNGRVHKAQIVDGAWLTENGTSCHSPSAAANDVARTKTGDKTQLNGLLYWRVLRDGQWIPLSDLAGRKKRVKAYQLSDF